MFWQNIIILLLLLLKFDYSATLISINTLKYCCIDKNKKK